MTNFRSCTGRSAPTGRHREDRWRHRVADLVISPETAVRARLRLGILPGPYQVEHQEAFSSLRPRPVMMMKRRLCYSAYHCTLGYRLGRRNVRYGSWPGISICQTSDGLDCGGSLHVERHRFLVGLWFSDFEDSPLWRQFLGRTVEPYFLGKPTRTLSCDEAEEPFRIPTNRTITGPRCTGIRIRSTRSAKVLTIGSPGAAAMTLGSGL
jgi:hypothetical protein